MAGSCHMSVGYRKLQQTSLRYHMMWEKAETKTDIHQLSEATLGWLLSILLNAYLCPQG